MASNDKGGRAAAQPIPQPISQDRRSSFAGWSPSFFGTSMPSSAMARSPPFSANPSFPAPSSASPPNNASSALTGIGIFRRFSVPYAPEPSIPPGQQQDQSAFNRYQINQSSDTAQPVAQAQSDYNEPQPSLSEYTLHKDLYHPQPRGLEEIRKTEDPPSRPDSRMRNLMLSGQFLL